MNYGLGTTLTPIKGLSIRLYAGINEASTDGAKDILNATAFVGYKAKHFSIGAEYNFMKNASHKKDADQQGYSIYATVNASKNVNLYARFDDLSSKNDWNIKKDEQAAILGAQFKVGKYVKIAPNFRMAMPKADGADEKYSAYVSCYFGI